MQFRGGALAGLLLVALSGCATLPPPASEEIREEALATVPLPESWAAAGAAAGPVANEWIATFADPRLDALVREAVEHNLDLAVAATRVERADAYARAARAALRPGIAVLGRGSVQGGGDFSSGLVGGLLNVSWELDLWGRLRYARNAAEETAAAARSDHEFARQSIAAATARNWFLAAETLRQRDYGQEMVRFAETYVGLAEKRLEVGVGTEKDVALAQANLRTYQDAVAQVALAHEQALRALELLLGRYPGAELAARRDLPALPPPAPAGMPLEVLERRPDLIAAERRVAAAFDRVGEAKAARLPKISLSAGLGVIESDVFELQEDVDKESVSGAARLVAPIYLGGALKEQVAVRTAEQREAVADYARRALGALAEVENALAAERTLGEREGILRSAAAENERALELEEVAFRVGTSDMRFVQQSQLALYGSRVALLRVESEQLIQRTYLHLALGGSFEAPPAISEQPAPASPRRE
jgi:NodT family efflux transporter outer membrane factor (OMF) lipoprotein